MRAANRKRTWLGNRRLLGGPNPNGAAIVPDGPEAQVVNGPGGASAIQTQIHGDPTQRLLTALGRFQRQVVRADGGAPQEQWVDECMNQLIAGIELAMAQDWDNVMQALTDTARVLASYENVERAGECVPFLQDAYEILCLMVGDLIVDNVRSGVMVKWRERYNGAVNDLARMGIPLMEDEEEGPAAAESAPGADSRALDNRDSAELEQDAAEHGERAALQDTPDDDEYGHAFEVVDEAEQTSAGEQDAPFDDPLDAIGPDPEAQQQAPHHGEWEGEEELDLPSLEDALGTVGLEEEAEEEEADRLEEEADSPDGESMERDAAPPAPDQADEPEKEAPAEEPAVSGDADARQTQQDLFAAQATLEETPAPPTEATPDTAGDAGGLFPDGGAPSAAPDDVEDSPAPAAASGGASDSAEHLLNTAQEALSLGNVADAKLLALELAVKMARMEADRAEARARECEARLDGNQRAIAEAEQGVARCEQDVTDADARVAAREQEHRLQREQMDALSGEMETVAGRIAELEAQIRELQAKRDEEQRLQEEIQGRYEEARDAESRIQTEIEALNESARQVQEGLEAAREHVVRLQQERHAREKELDEARRRHGQRQRSVEEINRTIQSVRALLDNLDPDEEVVSEGESGEDLL